MFWKWSDVNKNLYLAYFWDGEQDAVKIPPFSRWPPGEKSAIAHNSKSSFKLKILICPGCY